MSRKLDDLAPEFKPLACELIARCCAANIPVMVICTLRTPEEQQAAIDSGHSWTQNSRHLTGHAIDLGLVGSVEAGEVTGANWDSSLPAWRAIGEIGDSLGLTWGGTWKERDLGHFELPPAPAADQAQAG